MKITKKLMMAAGLFFQLSNLQAMTDSMQAAIDVFGGVDAVLAAGKLPANKKMNPGEAKKIAFNQGNGTPEAQAVAYYISSNVGGAKVQNDMFPDKDKADTTVTAALGLDSKPAPAPAPAQDKAADKKSADRDCSALEAQVADLQSQLDAAKKKSLDDKSEAAGYKEVAQKLKAQLKAAQAESAGKPSQDQLAAAQGKLAALQAKMAAGDQSLQALIQATQSAQGADKYIPLAKKAAQSLKAAVDSIQDADVQLQVMDAIKAELNFKAPADKNAKQSQNMGRLGKKNKNKRRA